MPYYHDRKQEAVNTGLTNYGERFHVAAQLEPYNGWVIILTPKNGWDTLKECDVDDILKHAEIHGQFRRVPQKAKPAPLLATAGRAKGQGGSTGGAGAPTRTRGAVPPHNAAVRAIIEELNPQTGKDRKMIINAAAEKGITRKQTIRVWNDWRKESGIA